MTNGGIVEIDIPTGFDMDLSLKPSFILPLFTKVGRSKYVKLYGDSRGCIIEIKEGTLVCRGGNISRILEWTGLWFDPYKYLRKLGRSERAIVERLLEIYHGLRIPVSTSDEPYIFIAVFLSRNTDYYRNTMKWLSKIFPYYNNYGKLPPLVEVGGSYQLKQLEKAFLEYKKYALSTDHDLEVLRRVMLKIPNVGPKTADAYIMYAKANTFMPPVDIHFIRFSRRLLIGNEEFTVPLKAYCLKYSCENCPLNRSCLSIIISKKFGFMSGWIQTVSYLHDRDYCVKKACNNCSLKDVCYGLI